MDVTQIVAGNARKIRESKKLTLDEAACATGVSRSMLAQIERGSVNPTISILWKIAGGYKVSFTALLKEADEGVLLRKADASEPLSDDYGRFLSYPAFLYNSKRHFESYRLILAPGAASGSNGHMQGTEEYITVFTGQVEITVNERCYPLKEGDSLSFRADGPHAYRNPGTKDTRLSMLIYYEESKE